ncbi:MAG: glucokinase [Acuticoccus sp.]
MTIPTAREASDTAAIPFPVLIADIGGTNVRFSLLSEPGAPLDVFETVATGDFPGFSEAARHAVLERTGQRPRAVLMAIAGPANAVPMRLTNAHWVIDPAEIAATLSLSTVIVFNDFEALSLSLPALGDDQLMRIGDGVSQPRKPRLVLGPGTGLGVAALHYGEPYFIPLPGEGGHMTIGPETARDFEIWPHLERVGGRISGEALLSGNGLARLYRGIAAAAGEDRTACRSGADVTARAQAGEALADEAVSLFLTYLGRYAGNLALVFLPEGGVYIAGGIAPRLAARFAESGFRNAFEAKEPHAAILKAMPTYLVTEPRPAIAGMATFAEMPERFVVDLAGRRHDR